MHTQQTSLCLILAGRLAAAVAGIAGVFSVCGIAATAHADTVVVTADRMIDVIAGRAVDRPQITVVDGRITAVGNQGSAVPAGARRGSEQQPSFAAPH